MVRSILLLAFIISVCFGLTNTYDSVKFLTENATVEYTSSIHSDDNECVIVTNKNETIRYNKSSKYPDVPSYIETDDNCSVYITVNLSHSGIWTFKNKDGKNKRYFISVTKAITPVRYETSEMKVFEKNYIFPSFPETWNKTTACYLIHEKERNYDVYNLFQPNNRFELVNQCGVRFQVTFTDQGIWHLYAIKDESLALKMSFNLKVESNINQTVYKNELIKRGTKNYELSTIKDPVELCIITDSHGKIVANKNNVKCSYTIPLLSSYHAGNWTFHMYLKQTPDPINYIISVILDKIDEIKINVTYYDDKVTALYNLTNIDTIKTCKFKNPLDETINVFLGTANDKIEYYGESYGEHSVHQECGITIHNPTTSDFGLWKCIITTENSQVLSALIYIGDELNKFQISQDDRKLYVKEDEPFKIKCGVNRRLSYCWLRSPNGTVYNIVSKRNSLPNMLLYEGSGLHMGECGTILPNASRVSDQGIWSCHMGLADGPDIRSDVSVIVTDSILIPVRKKINILPTDKTIELSCMAIPGSFFQNDYCQWISNNGTKILKDYDNRFSVTGNVTLCTLMIQDTNLYELTGQWTCIVGKKKDKLQASIEVSIETNNFIWITATSVSLALIAITICIYFVIKLIKTKYYDDKEKLLQKPEFVETVRSNISKTRV